MCAGNDVFSHTKVAFESQMVRQMLCFTIETAVRGCEGRRCETAGAAMFAYVRLWSPMVAYRRIGAPLGSASRGCESHCNCGVKVALGGRFAALCELQIAVNRIVMVV